MVLQETTGTVIDVGMTVHLSDGVVKFFSTPRTPR